MLCQCDKSSILELFAIISVFSAQYIYLWRIIPYSQNGDYLQMNKLGQKKGRMTGLSSSEAAESETRWGKNILPSVKRKSFIAHFFANLGDPVIKILLFALGVNLIFVLRGGDVVESIGIAVSVFLATFISTLSERGSEAAFRRLSDECADSLCRVVRDSRVISLHISEIVVGDIVYVSAGEHVPADCYVIDGKISVDQSSLTGENRELEKKSSADKSRSPDSKSAVFRGCPVLSGDAVLEVFAVGGETFLGKISREVQIDTRESPLKLRLSALARQISIFGYVAAVLIALATLFKNFVIDSGFVLDIMKMKLIDTGFVLSELLHAFMLGLTVIVVAVPEGLPMMIAVVLSSNIKRMMRDNVLVRKPVGIEAAGSMDLLFTDKTGTLTEGKMSVGGIILGTGEEYSNFSQMMKREGEVSRLYELCCRYNTSSVISDGRALGGNFTERALLESVISVGGREQPFSVVYRLPFDSERKYSLVTLDGNERITLIKGAPEKLIGRVRHCMRSDGKTEPFELHYGRFIQRVRELTLSGERVLLICFSRRDGATLDELGDSLVLLCAVVLRDRIRASAKRSVERLQRAGIQVVMITGDNKDTARSIAAGCGIISSAQSLVITSEELALISDVELSELLPKLAVVARALPSDKSRLVRIAQERGAVVGMTGDGINDAPALRRADIGFSMGSGTQVAKDAGDIIILDNDLSSIAKAVLYGRTIFKSIRKFIVLQLTMNFCAVGVCMICPFMGLESPVTVVQMLWINIVMDTLGGLAFAGEAPREQYMRDKPKRRDERILNRYMINQIVVLGSFTVGLCLCFLNLDVITSRFRYSPDNIYLLTAFFALFIFSSVFNCFNSRTDRLNLFSGIGGNRAFIFIMCLVGAIQILFTYLGGSVLRTAPLELSELGYTMLLALLVFPAELIRKILWRLGGNKDGF